MKSFAFSFTIGILLLLSPLFLQAQGAPKVLLQPRHSWTFEKQGITFSNKFTGARLNDCVQLGDRLFAVTIVPENSPINRSPWYAFQISSATAQTISVRFHLTYPGLVSKPKLSRDGKNWQVIEKDKWTPADSEKNSPPLALLDVGPQPLWVFAHQPVSLKDLNAWTDHKAENPFARVSIIGKSQEGRPIRQLALGNRESTNFVFVIGRQHPPEVTGSVGLMSFVDTITADTELSKKFRDRFQTIVVPLVNPDGVEHGHWRSTLGGIDPNRDYGPFTQMETRAVRDALTGISKQANARVWLFLDFHSTSEDVFYTQRDEDRTFPTAFARRWLMGIQERFPDYRFKRDAAHNENLPTSKTWAYKTFGCAGITYEFGYATPFGRVREIASGAAGEMMKILLSDQSGK